VSNFNSSDIYGKFQEVQFQKALEFTFEMVSKMKVDEEDLLLARELCKKIKKLPEVDGAYILPIFTEHWIKIITGETMPEVKAITWFDKKQGKWLIQSVPEKEGSFQLHGPFLKQGATKMNFVHNAGFFAVSSTDNLNEVIAFLKENGL
jgi:uncharacterized UPF0160 family protein